MPGTYTLAAAALAIAVRVCLGPAAPARADDAVLLAAGDIGHCIPAAHQGPDLTADLLATRPEATILALGDLAYTWGKAAEFLNWYGPTWGRLKDRTRPVPGTTSTAPRERRATSATGAPAPASLDFSVRPDGARHQWRKVPPRELSVDLVADERLVWATGRVEAS
jgi:hypothetical protein